MMYPWFEITTSKNCLQGDLIYECPIIVPLEELKENSLPELEAKKYNVIILSQSCDLEQKKISIVQVCPFWSLKDFANEQPQYNNEKSLEHLRRGHFPGFHLLNKCELEGFVTDYLVVDFRTMFGIHINQLNNLLKKIERRIRLLPPYREHLSQAFARYFMRVGLPTDIPPFKK